MQPVTANLLKLLQHMNANVICDRKLTCSDDHLTVSTCKIQANGSFIPQNDQTIHIWANWWDEKKCIEHCSDIRNCKTYGFVILIVIRPSVLYICSGINCGYEVCSEILKIVQLTVRDFIGFKEEESQSKSPMLLFYYKP